MTTTVGAVFTCVGGDANPPVDRYEWKYNTGFLGAKMQLGGGDTWALTGDLLYG